MKNRVYALIITALVGSGGFVVNYTGKDIELANGEKIKSKELVTSLTKEYKDRNTDSLYITIHHTAGNQDEDINNIAKFHVEKRGWPAIAYHIAINKDGDVLFLNDIEKRTYHDSGQNTNSIGIVLIGNYQLDKPSDEMIEKVELVTDALCEVMNIRGIRAHRDTSPTLCCGINAYNALEHVFFNNE